MNLKLIITSLFNFLIKYAKPIIIFITLITLLRFYLYDYNFSILLTFFKTVSILARAPAFFLYLKNVKRPRFAFFGFFANLFNFDTKVNKKSSSVKKKSVIVNAAPISSSFKLYNPNLLQKNSNIIFEDNQEPGLPTSNYYPDPDEIQPIFTDPRLNKKPIHIRVPSNTCNDYVDDLNSSAFESLHNSLMIILSRYKSSYRHNFERTLVPEPQTNNNSVIPNEVSIEDYINADFENDPDKQLEFAEAYNLSMQRCNDVAANAAASNNNSSTESNFYQPFSNHFITDFITKRVKKHVSAILTKEVLASVGKFDKVLDDVVDDMLRQIRGLIEFAKNPTVETLQNFRNLIPGSPNYVHQTVLNDLKFQNIAARNSFKDFFKTNLVKLEFDDEPSTIPGNRTVSTKPIRLGEISFSTLHQKKLDFAEAYKIAHKLKLFYPKNGPARLQYLHLLKLSNDALYQQLINKASEVTAKSFTVQRKSLQSLISKTLTDATETIRLDIREGHLEYIKESGYLKAKSDGIDVAEQALSKARDNLEAAQQQTSVEFERVTKMQLSHKEDLAKFKERKIKFKKKTTGFYETRDGFKATVDKANKDMNVRTHSAVTIEQQNKHAIKVITQQYNILNQEREKFEKEKQEFYNQKESKPEPLSIDNGKEEI